MKNLAIINIIVLILILVVGIITAYEETGLIMA